MKPTLLIPPTVALVVAGIWLGSQRQSISTLEQENAVLQQAISARTSEASPDSPRSNSTSPAKGAEDNEPIDWKKFAAQFEEMHQGGGMSHMRTIVAFQKRLLAMTQEELVGALDEIAALDLSAQTRMMLEQTLIGQLASKNPEFALTNYFDLIDDKRNGGSWQLSQAMQEWAKKDPIAAIKWFDQQIDAGKFESKSLDGRSHSRIQFEGSLINVLLSSDPQAAGNRLAALPEDQREAALSHHSPHPLKEDDELAFAQLVREQVPQENQARTLANQASSLLQIGDYANVTGFLDRIQATPTERNECAERIAQSKIQSISNQKKVTREDLDTMREWVTSQAPEKTNTITGKVLADASMNGRKMNFTDAAELALEYHEASGSDDVLKSFLNGWPARQNKEQARILAEKISDVKQREDILKKLQ